ncbi:hypothetical protein AALO_G00032080 [Alosa alosa]|uniref:Uncharacterized protein n=1 Tax=Alosa alosa TaxID=278164 RepID=A0AAV6HC46_9TELE|nr:hypothetical protein AALO_G00032080 [Alosa alosa]
MQDGSRPLHPGVSQLARQTTVSRDNYHSQKTLPHYLPSCSSPCHDPVRNQSIAKTVWTSTPAKGFAICPVQ